MDYAYLVETCTCTFYLDDAGLVMEAHPHDDVQDDERQRLLRCVGLQYVASFDPDVACKLTALPTEGAPMLLAHVTEVGRIVVVSTGKVVRFVATHSESPVELGEEVDAQDSSRLAETQPRPVALEEACWPLSLATTQEGSRIVAVVDLQ